MADISLVIDVKQNGVTSAVKNTKALERNVKLLSDSFKGGGLSQRQYYKGLLELAQASGKSEKELRKYANELRRAERASAAAAAQAKLEAQARRDAAAAARVAAAAQRAATQAAAEAAKVARTQADANRKLRMEFREGYAAQVQLRAAQMRLNQARREGIVTDQEYQRQLARLNEVNQGNVRGTNNLGVMMQQAGYQVGDFAVQVQSGTNIAVAFGQQATQLVGALYLLPPATLAASKSILGLRISVMALIASLGVIIPIVTGVIAFYMRMKEANDSSAKSAENLDDKISSLKNTLQEYANVQEALVSGVSLDEFFASESVEKAQKNLDQLKKNLAALQAVPVSAGPVNAIIGAGLQYLASGEVKTAIEKVIDAETTLALLREKESQERKNNFAESSLALTQEIELLQYQAKYGADSAQARNAGLQQELRNRKAAIDAMEASGKLDENSAAALKLQIQRAFDYRTQIEATTLAEERRLKAIEAYLAYTQKQIDLQKERQAGVDAIRAAVDGELKSLGDQIALNNEILKFGKDSVEVATLRAAQEREAYRQQQISNDIVGNKLTLVMAEYDVYVKTTEQLSASEDKAKGLADALRDAASAMSSLQGFSDGLDKALAVSVAKVEALKRGSDAVIAGQIAGRRVDLESLIDATVASGVDRSIVERMYGGDRDKISQIEASETQRKALEEAQREANKKGPTSETGQEALDKLVREAESRRRLVGLTKEQARYEELLFKIQETNANKRDPLSQKELEAAAKKIYLLDEQTRVLEEQNKVQEALASIVESSMENAFMSMVDGTKSVKDAFKSMAAEIIKELYRILVVKRITGMVVGGFGGMTNAAVGGMTNAAVGGGSVGMTAAPVVNPMAGMSGAEMLPQAMGGAWMKGVQMFANGGVVDSPTMFGHSGGVGVMGEAGPEAIMPLKRGANGKLGVSVEGGSGSVVVNNNINVTGGSDPAAIRMEVAKLMPQITSATKSAVIDARRRGGQMKAAFG
jgi:hypothetical protein